MAKTDAVDPALDAAPAPKRDAAKPVAPTVPAQVRTLAVNAARNSQHAEEAFLSTIEAKLGGLLQALKAAPGELSDEAKQIAAAIERALK